MSQMKLRLTTTLLLLVLVCTMATAQRKVKGGTLDAPVTAKQRQQALKDDADWIPTGEWPFLNRRFQQAEVVTGFFNKKTTVVPCNIHIGNQTLWFMQADTLLEAIPTSISTVKFSNGDVYMPIGTNAFGCIVHEDSVGKVVRVRLIDKKRFDEKARDVSQMGSFTLSSEAFGTLGLNLISSYEGNPDEQPLPVIDTFFFVYNLEIFEVTDKNVLAHIPAERRREYKNFTRSAEILSHNQSSIMKIWQTFFVNR
ncbi:MAG: hypothetical protein J1F25_04395 [Prevotellaceae bacterium]|nr:hypothetical protein [Prevotellaceae bacterium]